MLTPRAWLVSQVLPWLLLGCGGGPSPKDQPFCPGSEDLSALVNPLIGSAGGGNVAVGALVPHGMVRLGPVTVLESGNVKAYDYGGDHVAGFIHTQLHGGGGSGNGYSQILFLPMTGPVTGYPQGTPSHFSHDYEEAAPGYYEVLLDDYQVRVELTATAHAGLHRYTFPASQEARVLIDLGYSLGDSRGGAVEIPDGITVQGYGEYNVHPVLDLLLSTPDDVVGRSRLYFYARFSKPFTATGTFQKDQGAYRFDDGSKTAAGPWIGAWMGFDTTDGDPIEVRVGLSLLGTDQAKANVDDEVGMHTFDEVRAEARARWNCLLNRLQVEGGTQDDRVIFYTALYHSLFQPADVTEAGGRFFSGADGRGGEFTWTDHRYLTDDWCAWDTFRTSRPLGVLVEPERVDDSIASYLHLFQQGGWLEKCSWQATGYSRVMIGNHAVAILADALAKGFSDYNLDLAWDALWKTATQDNAQEFRNGMCGYFNLGTPPEYVESGFVGHECDPAQSASMTLEYAYDDWCTAQVAKRLGREDAYQQLLARAQNFRNQFNVATGFMQGRNRDGSFVEPFDPTDRGKDFCEASAWIYTWFVPQDLPALVQLLGGEEAFLSRLDRFFDEGHFDPSNEPSFHTPYLYNLAGAPDRSQDRVKVLLDSSFAARPDGLPGNDDSGATSAWYLLGAIGLYPVTPGDGVYQIVSPRFERVTLLLHPGFYRGSSFVIEAGANRTEAPYIQAATLNGEPLTVPWIRHEQLAAGGRLSLQMGPAPSAWGRH